MCGCARVHACALYVFVLAFLCEARINACLRTHLCPHAVFVWIKTTVTCLSVRAHAGDSEGFLEDGLAGELGLYCHGYKPGGSGKGEFFNFSFSIYLFIHLFPSCDTNRDLESKIFVQNVEI